MTTNGTDSTEQGQEQQPKPREVRRVTCDAPQCEKAVDMLADSYGQALDLIQKHGWNVSPHSTGAWTYCPDCATNYAGRPPTNEATIRLIHSLNGKGDKTMTTTTTEQKATNRVDNSETLSQYRDLLLEYDWENRAEHLDWVATATEQELVGWAEGIRENEASTT